MTARGTDLMAMDVGHLAGLPAGEVRSLFTSTLDAFEGGELDLDRLPLLGMRLAAAGHADLDVDGVEWASSSAARLDIVSNLLVGLWRAGGAGTRITPAALERLIAVHDALQPGEDVEYPYLLALAEAAEDEAARPKVRGILEAALGKPLTNGPLSSLLHTRLERALGARGDRR